MSLSAISFLVLAYVLVRVVIPLKTGVAVKVLLILLNIAVAFKYYILTDIWSDFSDSEAPYYLVAGLNWLYLSLLFLFVCLVVRDLFLLVAWAWTGIHSFFQADEDEIKARKQKALVQGGTGSFAFWAAWASLILAGFSLYGGLKEPEVRTTEIVWSQWPSDLDGMTAVQLSDLHVSPLYPQSRTQSIVEKVNALNADFIFLTGDLLDGSLEMRRKDIEPLRGLKAQYGVFGVLGNHEYYSDLEEWIWFLTREIGIRMLVNSHQVVNVQGWDIVVAGVGDSGHARRFRAKRPVADIDTALEETPLGCPVILLAHRPDKAAEYARAGAGVQLSGHTHGGMIYGLKEIVARFNKGFVRGLYQVQDMILFVSSGAGMWNGFPFRLGVPSEINRLVFYSGSLRPMDSGENQ
jgi:predicted MPP superfamily phosphohydrolase